MNNTGKPLHPVAALYLFRASLAGRFSDRFACFDFLILVALILLHTSPALADSSLNQEEQAWLKQQPVFVVGVQPDWKPFDFSDPDTHSPQGVVHELVSEIAHNTGMIFAYRVADWHILYSEFQQGKIDILPAIRHTEERAQTALFTRPYLNLYQYFFAHADAVPSLKTDFSGARLAIPRSYASAVMAQQQYPEMDVLLVNTVEEAINKVLSREADLLLDIYSSLNYQLKELGVQWIQPYRPFDTLELRMATPQSQPELHRIVQKALDNIPDSYVQQLNQRWLPVKPSAGFIPLTHAELSRLKHNPVIYLDSDINWLPLAQRQGDSVQGMIGDVLANISQRLNIRFQYSQSADQSTKPQIRLIDQHNDTLPDGYRSVAQLGQYPLVLISNHNVPFINDLNDLEQQTLVTVGGATYLNTLRQHYPTHVIDTLQDGSDVLLALRRGDYDVALLPAAAASYLMQLSEFQQLSISGITDIHVNATLLVHQDYPVLADTLERAYAHMTSVEKAAITNAWGKLSIAPGFDYHTFLYFLIAIAIVSGLIIYWNHKLSQEVRHRKAIEIAVRQERDNFQALFQQAMEGNLIFQDNHCVKANRSAAALFGEQASTSMQDRSLEELFCPTRWDDELYTRVRSAFTTCTFQGYCHLEFWIHSPSKGKIWINASLTLIHYLKKPSIYMVCRDVSAQKQLEQELSDARQAAEAGNQAKSDFIARISHEIRTPLNVILGSTRLLRENSRNTDLVIEKSLSIQRAGERLLLQIEDVLNFSRLEANEMPLYEEPLNLAEIAAENADFFCDMASKKYLVLECHTDPELEQLTLMLDLSRLNQILANLITNAIKYTREGTVTVHAGVAHIEHSLHKADVYVAVQDTGVGIAPEEQHRIFENFVRTAESENQQQEGTGLGLAISSKLAQLMGGQLSLTSTPGQGSTFTLRLRAVRIGTDQDASRRRTLTPSDRQAIIQAHKSQHMMAQVLPDSTREHLPEWVYQLPDDPFDALRTDFLRDISPLLEQVSIHTGLGYTQQLAQALQALPDKHIETIGDQLAEACRICDIASIEKLKKQLETINRVMQQDS